MSHLHDKEAQKLEDLQFSKKQKNSGSSTNTDAKTHGF